MALSLICAASMSQHEGAVLHQTSVPQVLTPSVIPLPQCSLSLMCSDCTVDVSSGVGHPMVRCSLHFDWMLLSVLVSSGKNKLLC